MKKKTQAFSQWSKGFSRIKKDKMALWSILTIGFYLLIITLSSLNLIATDFALTDGNNTYSPPSLEHWFGTDFLGRNVLSRAIHGTRIAFIVGFFSAALSTLIGLLLGSIAGYFGGLIDDLIVWFYSTIDSIPYILLISAFSFSLGSGLTNLFIALGLTGWVKLCRLTRGEVIKHRNQDYVLSAQALGLSHSQRLFKHIVPNILHLSFIQFSLSFVTAIKLEVILSYLGLGVEPGTPSWGLMINDAATELTQGVWWNLAAAVSFMFFLILAINLFTDALRTALDPKLNLQ